MPTGREGQKAFATAFRASFPDTKVTIEKIFGADDRVAVRWTATAAHGGEFMGIPATGKPVSMSGNTIYRLAGGKIAEEWTQGDMLGLMQQVGVVPETAQVLAAGAGAGASPPR